MMVSICCSVARACVQAAVRAPGARGQHFAFDAQRQQVLAEVVVDLARDAFPLEFLDLVGVVGQAAQLLVRQLQLVLALAQLAGHFLGQFEGGAARGGQGE